jgi:hypothetical protein
VHPAVAVDRTAGRDQCLRGDLAAEGAQRRTGVAPAAEEVLLDVVEPQQFGEGALLRLLPRRVGCRLPFGLVWSVILASSQAGTAGWV